jgi:regulator of nonsense transcripts 1
MTEDTTVDNNLKKIPEGGVMGGKDEDHVDSNPVNGEEEQDEGDDVEDDEESVDSSLLDEDDEEENPIDPYDESTLPEYACRYCGIHDPAAVAKCVESKKWFCNGSNYNGGGSHLVNHLVRSRYHQVQLHPNSPLGDTVLECYNCASKNAFVLGFVPASSGTGVVVLLCRVCVETVPALKDMEWELSQWHPLVQDRKFLPWLVKVPSDKQQLRARDTTQAQLNKLEELWKTNPDARFSDIDRPDVLEEEMQPTLLQYEDGYHYQNILAPLVKLEADYDKQIKESLSEDRISVRWEKSLTGKNVASFAFHRHATESRIMVGDELRLKLGEGAQFLYGKHWEGVGYVKDIIDGEVELELRQSTVHIPDSFSEDFVVEYIWKSTSFDRMQNALKTFAIDDTSVTGYIYHKLLGHQVEEQRIATAKLPIKDEDFTVPGLPPLNEIQKEAVLNVIQRPLSLIQGPPVSF